MKKIILSCSGLCKTYGSQNILNNISFEVAQGERIALVGPSGSGKTTLLNCLSGVDKFDSGRVVLAGVSLHECSEAQLTRLRRDRIGTVFQFFHLLPTLSARENIEFPLILKEISPAKRKERVTKLLEEIGLTHRADALPAQLSGGEMQRIAIARALSVEPDIIFADEPTGNLDSQTGKDILSLIQHTTQVHNTALILVTHSEEAASICSRRITVRDGQFAELL